MEAFLYIGRTIAYNNNDWAAVYQNLQKSRRQWGMVASLMERTGETVWAQRPMYKAVAQPVLFYCSKRWMVTGDILKVLEGFRYRASQYSANTL